MMSGATEDEPESRCSDLFRSEHLQEYLGRVVETLGIRSPKFCVTLGSKVGDNYAGVIYRVEIEGQSNGVPVKIQTIFKIPPTNEIVREIMQIEHLFLREHEFYSEIVPIFKEFLQAHRKTLGNIPECYFSTSIDHKEAICMEDLQSKGFVMRDRIKQLDFAHASLVLRALGRFHAVSFGLRDQKQEVFASKISHHKEPLFRPDVVQHPSFIERCEILENLVKMALADEDPRYTKRFTEFRKTVTCDDFACPFTGCNAEPYAVLNHGDLWTNNLLFKYDEDHGEPQDLYFLDFQSVRYVSPAIDISYVLFCSCNQELRNRHFDELIKIYHESLSAYLYELGSEPQKLFPYEELLRQMRKFSTSTGITAMMVLPAFTSQGDDVKAFEALNSDIADSEDRIQRDYFWRNTLRDTYKDLIDRNYI
ncbi:uncharacterized protein LOC107222213 [Neodiprion lecontei]|uniref:Uncharacterized protein LOC107222213 n=1 Tax=Neodiprion lecontei TaxID=441921 RepID=A0A6J0BQZ8_NEOLC|nr:uncharacterized protein LOC107222213 [Neodiprion lecontei]